MTQIAKSDILHQTKVVLKTDKKELTSQLFAADVEGNTAAPLLSTFTSRKTTTKYLQREQSEGQEDCAQKRKASRAPTSSNPLKSR